MNTSKLTTGSFILPSSYSVIRQIRIRNSDYELIRNLIINHSKAEVLPQRPTRQIKSEVDDTNRNDIVHSSIAKSCYYPTSKNFSVNDAIRNPSSTPQPLLVNLSFLSASTTISASLTCSNQRTELFNIPSRVSQSSGFVKSNGQPRLFVLVKNQHCQTVSFHSINLSNSHFNNIPIFSVWKDRELSIEDGKDHCKVARIAGNISGVDDHEPSDSVYTTRDNTEKSNKNHVKSEPATRKDNQFSGDNVKIKDHTVHNQCTNGISSSNNHTNSSTTSTISLHHQDVGQSEQFTSLSSREYALLKKHCLILLAAQRNNTYIKRFEIVQRVHREIYGKRQNYYRSFKHHLYDKILSEIAERPELTRENLKTCHDLRFKLNNVQGYEQFGKISRDEVKSWPHFTNSKERTLALRLFDQIQEKRLEEIKKTQNVVLCNGMSSIVQRSVVKNPLNDAINMNSFHTSKSELNNSKDRQRCTSAESKRLHCLPNNPILSICSPDEKNRRLARVSESDNNNNKLNNSSQSTSISNICHNFEEKDCSKIETTSHHLDSLPVDNKTKYEKLDSLVGKKIPNEPQQCLTDQQCTALSNSREEETLNQVSTIERLHCVFSPEHTSAADTSLVGNSIESKLSQQDNTTVKHSKGHNNSSRYNCSFAADTRIANAFPARVARVKTLCRPKLVDPQSLRRGGAATKTKEISAHSKIATANVQKKKTKQDCTSSHTNLTQKMQQITKLPAKEVTANCPVKRPLTIQHKPKTINPLSVLSNSDLDMSSSKIKRYNEVPNKEKAFRDPSPSFNSFRIPKRKDIFRNAAHKPIEKESSQNKIKKNREIHLEQQSNSSVMPPRRNSCSFDFQMNEASTLSTIESSQNIVNDSSLRSKDTPMMKRSSAKDGAKRKRLCTADYDKHRTCMPNTGKLLQSIEIAKPKLSTHSNVINGFDRNALDKSIPPKCPSSLTSISASDNHKTINRQEYIELYHEYTKLYDFVELVSQEFSLFASPLNNEGQLDKAAYERKRSMMSRYNDLLINHNYKAKRKRYEQLFNKLKVYSDASATSDEAAVITATNKSTSSSRNDRHSMSNGS